MANVYRPNLIIFPSGTASPHNGGVVDCTGLDSLWMECQVINPTLATLSANIAFFAAVDQATSFIPATNGVLFGSGATGFSWSAGTGVLTILNPGAGSISNVVLRFDRPARYLRPTYTFTSGGGTYTVRLAAQGWQTNTTP